MSANDFNGRLLVPVIGLALRVLSNNASTDSCNMRCSFLTIMSGAFKSLSLRSLLFLLITLLYKSFKSDVANLPPSNGTKGLKSGGITGRLVSIIHSGLLPDDINCSTSFNLLKSFFFLISDFEVLNSSLIFIFSSSKFMDSKIFLMASAPIPAEKESAAFSSKALLYSSSDNICLNFRFVNPGSITM